MIDASIADKEAQELTKIWNHYFEKWTDTMKNTHFKVEDFFGNILQEKSSSQGRKNELNTFFNQKDSNINFRMKRTSFKPRRKIILIFNRVLILLLLNMKFLVNYWIRNRIIVWKCSIRPILLLKLDEIHKILQQSKSWKLKQENVMFVDDLKHKILLSKWLDDRSLKRKESIKNLFFTHVNLSMHWF